MTSPSDSPMSVSADRAEKPDWDELMDQYDDCEITRADLRFKLLEASRMSQCTVPPPGWWCSREPGHEGPCAARPISPAADRPVENSELRRVREDIDAYLDSALQEFAEQDAISLKVYYRVSPEFIAAVRQMRLEIARLRADQLTPEEARKLIEGHMASTARAKLSRISGLGSQ